MPTPLLSLYQDELRSLRKDARIFSQNHHTLAPQLGLDWGATPDPMVERLIESTAWLTARIRQDSEARLPLAAQQILDNLCPSFTRPIPSVAIATLIPPDNMAKTNPAGTPVPANSRFVSTNPNSPRIRWRTAWDITLTAAKITDTRFLTPQPVLQLTVENLGPQTRLSLFLKGDPYTTHPFHEFIMTNLKAIQAVPENTSGNAPDASFSLPPGSLTQGGLSHTQTLFPSSLYPHPAHQLMQEYFLCPDRFLYWNLTLPENIFPTGRGQLLLILKQKPPPSLNERLLEIETNAVPVVNLFDTLSEPVVFDHTRHSFTLRADAANGGEIHSVLSMEAIRPGVSRVTMPRYFSGGQATFRKDNAEPDLLWHSRRRPSVDGGMHTEVFIKTTDGSVPSGEVVIAARVLCTNGSQAATAGAGSLILEKEDANPAARALLERPPTPGYDPLRQDDELWRLVSLFSLQRRAFKNASGTAGAAENEAAASYDNAETLKTILRFFAPPSHPGAFNQIEAICGLERRETILPLRPTRIRPMGGVASGHEYTLSLSPENFAQTSAYLFGAVLDRFFSLQAGLDGFTRLKVVHGGADPLCLWPARNGREAI